MIQVDLERREIIVDEPKTLLEVYFGLKNHWRHDTTAIQYEFPMVAVTDEIMETINGWDLSDDSIQNIRSGGLTVRNSQGNIITQYAGIIALGDFEHNQLHEVQAGQITNPPFDIDGRVIGIENFRGQVYCYPVYHEPEPKQQNHFDEDIFKI